MKSKAIKNIKKSIEELEKALADVRDVYVIELEGKSSVVNRVNYLNYTMLKVRGMLTTDPLESFKPVAQMKVTSMIIVLSEAANFDDGVLYFGSSPIDKMTMIRMALIFGINELKEALKIEGY
ncbi:hypothetical protein [Mammaliicoccus sciuri]|uniref:Uncharacterized protein n=1 Tax=Mammaliicoccus sciuri TaxID=1296 RepID=A0ABT7HWI0_MAMSC|nr:hypothetical protein [Mammaliicoccus sciuri]MDL0112075.1 hypothetical protein [Mammaliicoccus sciuri]MDL0116491.1 hypothetical protein [Mammaliicoccus sciuri]